MGVYSQHPSLLADTLAHAPPSTNLPPRRLFGYGGADGADAAAVVGGGEPAAAAAARAAARMQFSRLPGLMQRPPLEGPFAEKVGVWGCGHGSCAHPPTPRPLDTCTHCQPT